MLNMSSNFMDEQECTNVARVKLYDLNFKKQQERSFFSAMKFPIKFGNLQFLNSFIVMWCTLGGMHLN